MPYDFIPALRPFSYQGAAPSGSIRVQCALEVSAQKVYVGQLVKLTGGGNTEGTLAEVAVMLPGDGGKTYGVITGFEDNNVRNKAGQKYIEASATGVEVFVEADPNALFKLHSTIPMAAIDIGLNIDIVAGTADDAHGFPGIGLDRTTKATTATLPLRLVSIANRVDNVVTDAEAIWVVRMNNHVSNSDTGA